MKESTTSRTIGDIVAADFRTARVFEKHGIDFCCGGNVPLAEACREKGINEEEVCRELDQATAHPMERSQNYAGWEVPFLADYIINTHHGYLKEDMGKIAAYADKIAEVHGANHPEVIRIARIFNEIAAEMTTHLREEEEVFFPAIKRIHAAKKEGLPPAASDVETLTAALATLRGEHEAIGNAIHAIRDLSHGYAIPDDVCNTFAVTYRMLKEFEDDLHKHVHLENNVLFPKAAHL